MPHALSDLVPWVPVSVHRRTTRLLQSSQDRVESLVHELRTLERSFATLMKANATLSDHVSRESADKKRAIERAQRAESKIAMITAALDRVAVYDGLVETSSVPRLVDELVRDHEELEARIDAVAHLITAERDGSPLARMGYDDLYAEIGRLLQGGTRVPDTIEGLDD